MAPGSYKTCHRPDMAYGLQFADAINIFFITMTKKKQLCKDHLKVILNLSTYFFIYYHKTHQYTWKEIKYYLFFWRELEGFYNVQSIWVYYK